MSDTNKRFSGNINKYGQKEVNQYLYNLQHAVFFNKKIEKVVSKKIKRYPIYKFEQNNGKLYKKFKYTNLDGFKKHFNINKTNKIVGIMPDYVGASPSKMVLNYNIFTKTFLNYKNDIKNDTSVNFYNDFIRSSSDTRVVYSSGYTTCHSHLKEFF